MRRVLACFLITSGLAAAPLAATEVKIFKSDTREAFLAGTPEGVSVDPVGRLELAHRADRVTGVEEPFLLSAAAHGDGWVVGTGNDGRVLRIDRQGNVTELYDADEPEVFAVHADPDGTVWAATSPNGKVYRIDPAHPGEAQVWLEPGETYVWDLDRAPDGSLLVATGTQGKLFQVTGQGEARVLYDTDDTHVRSLAVTAAGEILLGTAGEGLILSLTLPQGGGEATARTLYDAPRAPEVVALVPGPDGAYAALVASEASLVDLSGAAATPSSGGADGTPGQGSDEGGVTISAGAATPSGSRRTGSSGPRSEIVRINAGGLVESLAELSDETVFSLLHHGGRLWVGTGLEGKLYTLSGPEGRPVLEKDVDERQIVALMGGDPGPAFATTNAAALYRVAEGSERKGVYTSDVLDAAQIARFGSFRWHGSAPGGAGLRFSFRSGMSAEPDRTWSPWTPWQSGSEIDLSQVPRGRYVQWRSELTAGNGETPVLSGIELSYLQDNLAPAIETLEVMEPGQVLVEANFNPSNQVFEPVSPNREGIFTTLEASSSTPSSFKPLWKKGWRTLRWEAEDPNEDGLVAALHFQTETRAGAGWLPVVEDLEESHYSFDATSLPDGVYRFRLTVSDRPDNRQEEARSTERVSEPVVLDHSNPVLDSARVRRNSARVVEATVADAFSPLRRAEVSFDAGEWRDAATADGLLDARRETFEIEVPEGARLVLLRVVDAAHNVATFDLSEHLP